MTISSTHQGSMSEASAALDARAGAAPNRRRRRGPGTTGRGWLFLIPFGIIAFGFLILPAIWGFVLSLTDRSLMGRGAFIGLDNYAQALGDPTMWQTLWNTLLFTVLSTVPLVVIALAMAILVYTGVSGQWLWRFAFFAPYLLPSAVVVQIWVWLFEFDLGFINFWLQRIGLNPVGWLTDPNVAMMSMVILTVWWTVGFNFLLYLSALQAIPDQQYEAATLDGAGPFRILRSIILPQMVGTTMVVGLLQLLNSLKVFDQMFIAFEGGAGPSGSTRSILQYIYDTGFTNYQVGYASAMSYIFFALVIILTVVVQALSRIRRK
jgi:multiple sugar transport system permease protein